MLFYIYIDAVEKPSITWLQKTSYEKLAFYERSEKYTYILISNLQMTSPDLSADIIGPRKSGGLLRGTDFVKGTTIWSKFPATKIELGAQMKGQNMQ